MYNNYHNSNNCNNNYNNNNIINALYKYISNYNIYKIMLSKNIIIKIH